MNIDVINEARKGIHCLYLAVATPVADDMKARVEALIAEIERQSRVIDDCHAKLTAVGIALTSFESSDGDASLPERLELAISRMLDATDDAEVKRLRAVEAAAMMVNDNTLYSSSAAGALIVPREAAEALDAALKGAQS